MARGQATMKGWMCFYMMALVIGLSGSAMAQGSNGQLSQGAAQQGMVQQGLVQQQQVSRAQAASMDLQQKGYYFIEDTSGLAALDARIRQRVAQGSSTHYAVVYFMPQRDRDIYQALVTEYSIRQK
ncbi:hypothetical protein [Photobacterium sp. TY1-4]|uniref:hypothetical protein n=1 Tax=Photobacterium sp. TY1-4 TaxID=2899122 RepID=UPI0021BFC62C|nr:hypothetical protein [Photobacterium sp. TY1-4]UXI00375.1 hypothetical protein NH461_11180 [Photobacterium sp. TY1-4]